VLTVALALSASLCWGSADFLAGVATRRIPVLTVLLWSQVIGLVITVAAVAIRGEGPPPARFLLYGATGGAFALVGVWACTAASPWERWGSWRRSRPPTR
jgi:drug/metabolite transporter (DMT)-like permease